MTEIWAHRGASGDAPENTLPAIEQAIEQGADGVEIDVQLTRDDVVVVIHDETLERTTDGNGWVADHAWSDLARLDAGAGRPGFAGTRIPRLEDVLALLADTDLVLNVELKNDRLRYKGMEERAAALVAASGMADRVWFSSFNHYSLKVLERIGAPQPRGALYSDPLFKPWRYVAKLGVQAIHPAMRRVNRKLVANSHERGLRVHAWTANARGDVRRLVRLGVDAVMTDRPGRARDVRDAEEAPH